MLRTVSLFLCLFATQLQAMDLWLKESSKLSKPYVKLSDLLENKEHAQRFKSIFLGKNSDKRRISLKYISSRLEKSGFFTVKPRVRSGKDYLYVVETEVSEDVAIFESNYPARNVAIREKPMKISDVYSYVVVKYNVRRGNILKETDLEIKKKNKLVNRAVVKLSDAYGMRLKKTIRQGSVLLKENLEFPPVVNKGDMVKVLFKSSQIEITGIGKAVESGLLGEVIQVKRKRDNVSCKVLGKNLVQVVSI